MDPHAGAAPSDGLRRVYERRAALEYPKPPSPHVRRERKFVRMMELFAGTLPASSVLDADCGDGRHLAEIVTLVPSTANVVGVDISARMLETAAATLASAQVCVRFVRANLESLPFADRSFDRVLSVQVVEHLLAPEQGLRELARVLTPGGLLVLSTDNSGNWLSKSLNLPRSFLVASLGLRGRRRLLEFPHRSFTRREVRGLIESAGLEIECIETFRLHLDPPFARPTATRLLSTIDRHLPSHPWGDLIAVVVRKPAVADRL